MVEWSEHDAEDLNPRRLPISAGRSALAVATLSVGLVVTSVANAETVFAGYAGAGSWQQNYSGDIRAGFSEIDVEDDLGIDDEFNNMFYLAVEHPMPFLPDVRVSYADFDVDSNSVLSRPIDFNGVVFPTGTAIGSTIDMMQGDAMLYYELLDNYVSLDLGLGARYLDGSIELVADSSFSEADFTTVIPMFYGRARTDLPLTGFWMGAEVQGMGYSDHNLIDANAQFGWESSVGLGAELGWRLLTLDIDDVDDFDKTGIDISGPYLALNYHF
jgi:outer membrane protein